MIAVDLNPLLQDYLVSQGFRDIEITPLAGYSDSPAPFITWEEAVSTRNAEQYWMRDSVLTYYIYDTDLSRAKNIAKAIEDYLHVGDMISDIIADMTDPVYRLCWCRMASGDMFPPLERDGFASIVRSFDVGFIEI